MIRNLINITMIYAMVSSSACNEEIEFHEGHDQPFSLDSNLEVAGIERTFHATEKRQAKLTLDGEKKTTEVTYQLTHNPPRSMSFLQYNRPTIAKEFIQGHSGFKTEQQFPLRRDGALDILIVVDNSHSMEIYQERLAERFEPLLTHIDHTDWQIAVVTTDGYCRRNFGQVITRDDYINDPASVNADFKKAIEAGVTGHPVERGIEMAIKGMRGDCGGEWVRENSKKAVLLISDEENCGSASNEGCPGQPGGYDYFGPEEFSKELGSTTKFYGILYDKNSCEDNFYEKQPEDYYELVGKSKGLWGEICQNDYTELLTSISRDVGAELVRKFELEKLPSESLVGIKVDGVTVQNPYTIDGNTVTVEGDIAENAHFITVEYIYGSSDVFQSLPVENNADMETFFVEIDGEKLHQDEFSFSVKNGKTHINFANTPAFESVVTLKYRDNRLLENTFEMEPGIEPSSVQVFMVDSPNSQTLQNYFDPEKSAVVFLETPEDGQRFDVFYNLKDDYKTHYPIPEHIRSSVQSVAVWDKNTGDAIEAKIEHDFFIVSPTYIKNGREVNAAFTGFLVNLDQGITLPEMPVENSVKAEGDNCTENSVKVEGRLVYIECASANPQFLQINYLYRTKFRSEFLFEREIPINATWNVWVDGKPYYDFTIGPKSIVVPPEDLTPDSTVRVRVEFKEKVSNQ